LLSVWGLLCCCAGEWGALLGPEGTRTCLCVFLWAGLVGHQTGFIAVVVGVGGGVWLVSVCCLRTA
jgi:hypothetical protein